MSTELDPRDSLIAAASRVLADEGPAALTVRHIASEAGLSTMAVYSRFGGKDGVVDALFAEGFERLAATLEAVPMTDDPLEDLRVGCDAYRAMALANATHYAVMFLRVVPGFVPTDIAKGCAGDAFSVLVSHAQRAIDAGAIHQHDAAEVAASIWATCHGLVALELLGIRPPTLTHDPWDSTIDTLLRGLAADRDPTRQRSW